jgi:hypothetical protein
MIESRARRSRRQWLKVPMIPRGRNNGHRDEQSAENEQPIRREQSGGERGLGVIDQDGAEHGAGERAAAPDRDPDHRFDRIGGGEFARVDDADLRHIERAGDAGHAGRQREHEQLVGFHPIAEEARARFRVADRDQHLAEFGGHERAADDEAKRERRAGHRKQGGARALRLHVEAENVLEIGQPLLPPKPKLLRKKPSISAKVIACVMMER